MDIPFDPDVVSGLRFRQMGILDLHHHFQHYLPTPGCRPQAWSMGVLRRKDRYLSRVQHEPGRRVILHGKTQIAILIVIRRHIPPSQVVHLDALPATPEKVQVRVACMSFEPSLLSLPWKVALAEQVEGTPLQIEAAGFSWPQTGNARGYLRQATCLNALQQFKSPSKATCWVHKPGEIIHSTMHRHESSLSSCLTFSCIFSVRYPDGRGL
jgi:hypothetical protein